MKVIVIVEKIGGELVCFCFIATGDQEGAGVHKYPIKPPVEERVAQFMGTHKASSGLVQPWIQIDDMAPFQILIKAPHPNKGRI